MSIINQKVNGLVYDFSCVRLNVAGTDITGIQSISWSDTRDHQYVYGSGVVALGVTPGQYSGQGSLEMIVTDYNRILKSLTRWYDSAFSLSIIHTMGMEVPILEQFPKCYFTGRSSDYAVGSDALTKSMDFIIVDPVKTDRLAPNAENDSIIGEILRVGTAVTNLSSIL